MAVPKTAIRLIELGDADAIAAHQAPAEAHTQVENLPSHGVLRNNGFTSYGIAHAHIFIGGEWRDEIFWVENASIEWKESEAPFHTIARLRLTDGSQLPQDEGEAIYFDVNEHCTLDNQPLGFRRPRHQRDRVLERVQ